MDNNRMHLMRDTHSDFVQSHEHMQRIPPSQINEVLNPGNYDERMLNRPASGFELAQPRAGLNKRELH